MAIAVPRVVGALLGLRWLECMHCASRSACAHAETCARKSPLEIVSQEEPVHDRQEGTPGFIQVR